MPKKEAKNFNSIKIKTIILALVIAVVLCAFVIYLIQAIKPSPKYEDYCNINYPYYENITKDICETNGGTWTPENIQCIRAPCPQGYCDFYAECNEKFQGVQDKYNLVVFIIAVIIGLIAIFLGFRVFFYYKLLRKSNLKNFEKKFNNLRILFDEGVISREKALESIEGWLAYCSHADTFKYRKHLIRNFNKYFSHGKRVFIHNKKKYVNYIKKVNESKLEFSVQKTLFQFKKGLAIKEIASNRNIKESTIRGHLINLIEHRQLSVWGVLPEEKIHNILSRIYSYKERLKEIKKRFKDDISYDEIACVMASIKSKRKCRKPQNFIEYKKYPATK